MFDGVAGTTAVTLTANRTAAAAPIPAWPSRPSAASSAQQAASWIAQAPSWAAAATSPGADRGRRRGRPAPGSAPRAGRRRAGRGGRCRCAASAPARSGRRAGAASGTRLKTKSFWVPEWKRSVVETMITPSSTRATMLSSVCETRVPSRTGNVSRIRPVRRRERHRAGRLAEAGRQRRRHQHPDHRRRGDVAAADRAGWAARRARSSTRRRRGRRARATISAQAISTQVRSERTMLSTTLSTPILLRREGGQADAEHAGDAEADAAGDAAPAAAAARPAAGRAREAAGRGWRRAAVGGPQPGPVGDPLRRR